MVIGNPFPQISGYLFLAGFEVLAAVILKGCNGI
jgi:hypothetical protein